VTLRSSYWGQGGHNAALVVGDFFKGAFDAHSLDPKALFPGGRAPAPRRVEEPVEEIFEEAPELEPVDEPYEVPSTPDEIPVEERSIEAIEAAPAPSIPGAPIPPGDAAPIATPVF